MKRKPDYVGDPLERLERNERSTHAAVAYGAASFALVLALASVLSLAFHVRRGAGFTGDGLVVLLVPLGLALALTAGAMWQTYARWRNHIRWRPWLWLTQVLWIGTTAYLVLGGSLLLVSTR
ncbi:hypothetical protein [Dietzia sp.]|uniref:hypothetical protein n=1 Tax=Dietzia sp. TaxID=1871616 RepID=UPI002FD8D252